MITTVRVGTRNSLLATSQTKKVVLDYRLALIELSTKGDRDRKTPSSQEKQSLFTEEIGLAILDKQIDFAVHSLKDLPAKGAEGVLVASHPKRESPFDCLIM